MATHPKMAKLDGDECEPFPFVLLDPFAVCFGFVFTFFTSSLATLPFVVALFCTMINRHQSLLQPEGKDLSTAREGM